MKHPKSSLNKYDAVLVKVLDLFLSLFGLIVSSPVMLVILIIGYFETGSPMFCQERVGKNKSLFTLYKFRTMKLNTKSVASHLAERTSITKFGNVLRKTKLDELPQLVNVLKGDMSLVGPRPCLLNQNDVINEREKLGVFDVLPGITGLAQIKGVDMSTPRSLANLDREMIENMSILNYFKYGIATFIGRGYGDRIN